MKKIVVTMLIAILCGLLLSGGLILYQANKGKKNMEEFFKTYHDKISNGLTSSAYDIYMSDREDVSDSVLAKREGLEILSEGEYFDGAKQMQCYLSELVCGGNASDVYWHGKTVLSSSYRFYSGLKANIMCEDTLMFVRKETDYGTGARLYYTYQSDALTEQIDELKDKYGEDIFDGIFYVDGIYIKGDEFIPRELTFRMNDGGNTSDERMLLSLDEDQSSMEAQGYEYHEIQTSFFYGTSSSADSEYVTYCDADDESTVARSEGLMDQALSHDNLDTVIYNSKGPFTVELFSVSKFEAPDSDTEIYISSYYLDNIMYDPMASDKGLYLFTFILEAVLINLVAILAGIIVSIVRSRKKRARQ